MPTFKIIMYATTNIGSYAQLSAEINQRYCQRHGYAFAYEQYDDVALCPQHEKVRMLYRHLDSADYCLWLDSDACVIDFRQQLDQFCGDDKDFIIAGHDKAFDLAGRHVTFRLGEQPCGLNTGVMMVRRSQWSRDFLRMWWIRCMSSQAVGQSFHEQGQLQHLFMANAYDLQTHTHLVVPSSRLNRSDDAGDDACEFILHLWGTGHSFRQAIFSEILAGRRPNLNIRMPTFSVA